MSHLHALPGYLTFGGLRPAPSADGTVVSGTAATATPRASSGPEPGHAVEVTRLYVRRGGQTVLREVSLQIPRGSVTGLLGPSGCGKSTLIRSIMGVQRISGGSVTVLGRPAGSPDLRPRVGYVTQAPALYDDLTVDENLGYFARLLGTPADRVDEVLETVDLDHARWRLARNLSGGQRARVSLATALLGEPELLVLDEPTVGLDPVLRRRLWGTFEELAARGTTLLVSSHVMDEAARCDELLLMREGTLLATETPQRLRARTGEQDLEEAFLRLALHAERPARTATGVAS
ncbi:ABC transporter ATP-binding protein [Nocardioides guangzhouensis]|uniref:ABC transporter ATP-binding protein n=1 Tax=Nocardioides guangzhouensis TaxID=2497878 RepID=A0A4Q4Z1V3_9ACTN|nr:ABC transporter ATP-binding protein [Nocardioides guangzhouensis]RYP81607.1 ABC transporter ATP-binding protein [Nocardioides guangzhouensis]